ncbi:extracellular solute-binding protein [uncultured Ruminococcus sp.]|uniref:ABC transporter substrate-binding protein n=1 Tax=uncultured Ruminococcus sp. TaxID=165186 RepID=UPI0025EA24CD|nr:extracellular solute-binding protein [uncultured Ruminococcus sp.]
MKNWKRIFSGAVALVSVLGIASCGNSGSDSKNESSSYVDKVNVADTDDISGIVQNIEPIPDGADGELKWLSYFDINPTRKAPEKRTDLTLFEGKGGSIKYEQVSSVEKYEQLAARLMANDPPDMFWYEQKMTFPANCIKEMFQPIDDIIDFDTPLWSGVKNTADQFTLNGNHYVAPVKFVSNSVLTYDKDMISAAGLEDPYDLYMDGDWDWDTWYDMMDEYCKGASADEERYGVNGWFAPFIFQSTGKTLIQYDAEKDEYVSNLNDADFTRAADLLYNIKKNNMYYPDWVGQSRDAFKKNILFYAMGPWASIESHTPKEGDNWGVVPIPKDPNADGLYTTVEINAYMWVKGSEKKDAMRCWSECARIVNVQDEYIQTEKDKFFENNPYWTEEMYDMAYNEVTSDKYTQLIDPGYGISTTLSDDDAATNDTKEAVIPYLYTSVMKEDENGAQYTWTQLREAYSTTVESELKTFNEAYHKFIGK